ncbi:uncharacterized protein BDR25DRAFT_101802 [Lindgomyces ingoldianus]|uniref:Uncharacterized protein n=1 Tax=Lindgomyces ingoldianus TaxID=673940 RepID=A0ACB6R986_9PLEO|nr:uncharacterized protein BDR25DRAFT_101802 [Lindgomyces ingoldianus]KAF2475328.1 hypothetical protein BDR25DRAFT_101802 [Lindgomyces ingoldianus]
MSDPSETGGRPLASSIQQPEGSTQPPALRRKRRRSSQSSDERVGGTKSSSTRRRPGTRKDMSFGPHAGSSRGDSSMQRSHSPTQMSPEPTSVNYTRTGRISKAKKGLKVHHCDCGRSYTRAEHLRRHQKNHAQDALVCKFPECGKTFYRIDLLQRHQERHTEIGKDSRRPSFMSQGTTAEPEVQVSAPVTLPSSIVTTLAQAPPYYQQTVSPVPEPTSDPRYTLKQFRPPQIPSSAFGHVLRSSPNSNAIKQQRSYHSRNHTSVTVPVPVDGLQTDIAWSNSYNQSPNYSSSGYDSPVPYAGEHSNMFANPPYGPGPNRTRTSSNASFIEPWAFPSRSPTSATSTMACTWTSNDKSPVPPNLPFLTSTYSMTGMSVSAAVDPISGYHMPFGPKSMALIDEEEQAFLFPEQSFGTAHIANTYPLEQYLDNYWRLFHPSFPVIHRATFDGMNTSPMLRAAMIAIGAQYSNDTSAKRKYSRILHDRCRKLLDKRDLVMTEPERICDYQALLLIEVLSQYAARRAPKSLSPRFESMYKKLSQNFRATSSSVADIMSAIVIPENATYKRWSQWVELSSQQHLLLCCYILESQQTTLLARQPQPSILQTTSGFGLPFPAHAALWDATDHTEWGMAAQQYLHFPTYVYEITPETSVGPFDSFQSSLLIAAYYNHFSNAMPYLSGPSLVVIDHLLDQSPLTKHRLLTAKLLQVTPIRELLAVAGESWILSEKVTSPPDFANCKATLRTWVSALWTPTTDAQSQAVKDALKLAIEIMQHAMMTPFNNLRLKLGADMGLFFATLVIWAVTVAANTRINTPQAQCQPLRYPSHSPLPSHPPSGHYPSTPTHLSATSAQPSQSPNPAQSAAIGLLPISHTSPAPAFASNSMLHSEITMNSVNFLSSALLEFDLLGVVPQWPRDVAQWQQGSAALLRWVKMRLRNGAIEGRDSVIGLVPTSAGPGRGGDGLGELIDGVINVLEKVIGRGWDGWGV